MEFIWSKEDEAFRQELRKFIKDTLPPDWTGYEVDTEFSRSVERKLGERRWLTLAWPPQYGGLGASYWQQLIFKEEGGYHRLPGIFTLAVYTAGPGIMVFGNEEQKRRYLPGIAKGEIHF